MVLNVVHTLAKMGYKVWVIESIPYCTFDLFSIRNIIVSVKARKGC